MYTEWAMQLQNSWRNMPVQKAQTISKAVSGNCHKTLSSALKKRFYLHPTVNLVAIGFQRRDGIPSNFPRYMALKLPRDVDKFSSRCR